MTEQDVHPQLLADCHVLGGMHSGLLLLHRNAVLPWLILVPDTHETELVFVPEPQRGEILRDAETVARYLRDDRECKKVNMAALGNQVPQLHLHLVGRSEGDACWPKPVWGHLEHSAEWDKTEIDAFRQALISA